RQSANAHGQVGAFLDEVDEAVGEIEIDRHVRVAGDVLRQHRREMTGAEYDRGVDAQDSARLLHFTRHRQAHFLDVAQDLLTALVVRSSRFGEADTPRGAVEQPDAKALFEVLDVAADDGRRQTHAIGSRYEAPGLDYPHKRVHRSQAVHYSYLSK